MRPKRLWTALLLALAALLILAGVVLAQSGGDYDLTWSTIDGGGGTSEGGDYSLSGTAGQYDAGNLLGGSYTLDGGFWVKGIQQILEHLIHLPLVLK
jgi:hypothetical protein